MSLNFHSSKGLTPETTPQTASLAKIRRDVAERWEFYMNGMELANCFTELCDPAEQRQRFSAAREERRRLDEADYPIDEEFLAALSEVRSAAVFAIITRRKKNLAVRIRTKRRRTRCPNGLLQ